MAVELGSGSGYGAALAQFIVGPARHVTTIEIDGGLAARARDTLAALPNVVAFRGDAMSQNNADVERRDEGLSSRSRSTRCPRRGRAPSPTAA